MPDPHNPEYDNELIGLAARCLRLDVGMTQEDWAKQLDVGAYCISRYENGILPPAGIARRLMIGLGCNSPEEIVRKAMGRALRHRRLLQKIPPQCLSELLGVSCEDVLEFENSGRGFDPAAINLLFKQFGVATEEELLGLFARQLTKERFPVFAAARFEKNAFESPLAMEHALALLTHGMPAKDAREVYGAFKRFRLTDPATLRRALDCGSAEEVIYKAVGLALKQRYVTDGKAIDGMAAKLGVGVEELARFEENGRGLGHDAVVKMPVLLGYASITDLLKDAYKRQLADTIRQRKEGIKLHTTGVLDGRARDNDASARQP